MEQGYAQGGEVHFGAISYICSKNLLAVAAVEAEVADTHPEPHSLLHPQETDDHTGPHIGIPGVNIVMMVLLSWGMIRGHIAIRKIREYGPAL